MIYIFHGEDQLTSYKNINSLTSEYSEYQAIRLNDKDSKDDFLFSTSVQDLLDVKKIYILENFITKKKITPKEIKNISGDAPIIFWEKSKLTSSKFVSDNIKITESKLGTNIFNFLDSILPNNKNVFLQLKKIGTKDETNLIWQISNRLHILIIYKLNIKKNEAENITKRIIADWQWAKVSQQAGRFDTKTLMSMFAGILKIDFLIKSGKTNLQSKSLISILFIKYLKP